MISNFNGNQIYDLAWLPDNEPWKLHDFLIFTVSVSTAPFPGNWLAARIAGLTPDISRCSFLEGQLSWASNHGSLSPSVSSMLNGPSKPPPPPSPPSINLYITCCSDCTTKTLDMPKPAKPSLSQNEVEVLKLKLCQYQLEVHNYGVNNRYRQYSLCEYRSMYTFLSRIWYSSCL